MDESAKSDVAENPAAVSSAHARCGHDSVLIGADTSDDAFLGGQVQAHQLKSGYRAGSDAVMLAAAAPLSASRRERVLDAGAGAGVVSLCVAARCETAEVTLIEREPELCMLAAANMARNGWQARSTVIVGDLTAPAADLMAKGLELESYDHVLANPPFYGRERGTVPPDRFRAGARAMGEDGLERWVKFLAATAKPGGTMTMIHLAKELGAILGAASRRFGALKILPIHSREQKPAQRILVQGIKGSRAPLRILPGFIVHERGSAFTRQAEAILRHGGGLELNK